MTIDHIVGENLELLVLLSVIENLKCAEPNMRGRHTQ